MNITFPQEHTVELSDQSIMPYYKTGNGDKVILMIHGLGSNKKAWLKLFPLLSNDYTVYAIDLNKYLHTDDTSKVNLKAYAESIRSFLNKMKVEKTSICGHSMGGQIAVHFAHDYPAMLDKLILLAPAGLETFNEADKNWFKTFITKQLYLNLTNEQIKKNFDINFHGGVLPPSAEFMLAERLELKNDPTKYGRYIDYILASIRSMLNEPIIDLLPKIQTPTLVVFGKNDQLIPNRLLHPTLTIQDLLINARDIPTCETALLDEAGHFIQWDQPLLLEQKINQFIQKN